MPSEPAPRIVIAGGGVGAIEALLALSAQPTAPIDVTLVSASDEFRLPALAAVKPFGRGHADPISLTELTDDLGFGFLERRLAAVDADRDVIVLDDGSELPYDELIVAVGAQPVKGTDAGTGFDPATPEAVAGVAADIEYGYASAVAVVVPEGPTWPMPGYELALQLAHEMQTTSSGEGHVHLFIPTDEPLPFFGPRASGEVRDVLDQGGVLLHAGSAARVVRTGLVERGPGLPPIKVDRILAIPRLVGPAIPGLPQDEQGFTIVDARARVAGRPRVHAAGDGTNHELKFGALACQQADAAVADVLASLGHEVTAEPLDPVYDARLVAGDREVVLHHDPSGAGRAPARWTGGAKVAGRYLTPFLEERGATHLAHREVPRSR